MERGTLLGKYLIQRSVNRSEVSRKTGLSNARLSELCTNPNSHLRASEVYLISLAIGVDPAEMLAFVCQDLKLVQPGSR